MRKLGLLLLLFAFVGAMQAQNIVKSLERNVPGQGKVTIHQDPRIVGNGTYCYRRAEST